MIKLVFRIFVIIFLITSCKREKEEIKKTAQILSDVYDKDKVPYLKLPIDYSFEVNKKNIKGNDFYDQREKLNTKINDSFRFTSESNTLNIENEICEKYKEKCDLYFTEYDYSKTYKIENNFDFDLFLITSKYNYYLNLISIKEGKVIDLLNVYLNYVDYEGQECIYRIFSVDKDFNVSVFNYIYYEAIGEVEEDNSEDDFTSVYPSALLREELYTLTKKGFFEKTQKTSLKIGSMVYAQVETYLNVRSVPNSSGEIVAKAYPEDGLKVLEVLEGWVKVALNGKEGYVSKDFVK
ncbi:SH3 domain-containing protein [Cellulophaga baltica]|uniref:SH3 domain-containing protein n=1 Tax=Cellulophaga baltica TaxID=76594 RepID=UPI000429CCEC|nr:SH3 domain-containing protein [Cellulophaga baltica]AIY14637.1 hypothetical protein M667_16465 [Cellulophaga baltica NN016038]